MSSISSLQCLHLLIIERIVYHVSSCSRLLFNGNNIDHNDCPDLPIPFLSVCHSFRYIVYSQYCNELSLFFYFGISGRKTTRWIYWPCSLGDFEQGAFHLVKKLNILVDIDYVFSGKALDVLSRAPFDGFVLPRVRKAIFYMPRTS